MMTSQEVWIVLVLQYAIGSSPTLNGQRKVGLMSYCSNVISYVDPLHGHSFLIIIPKQKLVRTG